MAKLVSSKPTDTSAFPLASGVSAASRRRLTLEPRILLDAAAVETAMDVLGAHVGADVAEGHATHDGHHQVLDAIAPHDTDTTRQVIFIDSNVEGYQSLLAQSPANAQVFVIDADKNGFQQMDALLNKLGHKVDSISIVSHGSEAAFEVGSTQVAEGNLADHAADLQTLGSHLNAGGDLLLYGCNVAEGREGHEFVNQLAELTGADVAASTDVTGIDGNWTLEMQTGSIEAQPWDALHSLNTDLALDVTYTGKETGDGDIGRYMDGAGDFVAASGNNKDKVTIFTVAGKSHPSIYITPGDAGDAVDGFGTTTQDALSGGNITWTSHFGEGIAMSYNDAKGIVTLAVADPNAGSKGAIAIFQGATTQFGDINWVYRATIDVNQASNIGDGRIGPATSVPNYSTQYMAIDGNHLVVGTPTEGNSTGMVVAFSDDSGTGKWNDTISSYAFNEPSNANGDSNALFGASVSIANDYFVVGSPGVDADGGGGYAGAGNGSNYGSVFIFNWDQGKSASKANIIGQSSDLTNTNLAGVPNNGVLVGQNDVGGINGGGGESGAYFGRTVDIDYYNGRYTIGGTVVTEGAGGEVYLYETDNSSMTTLDGASNIYGFNGNDFTNQDVGRSLQISHNRIIIGAPGTGDGDGGYYMQTSSSWTGLDTNNPHHDNNDITTYTFGQDAGNSEGYGAAMMQGNVLALGAPGTANSVGFYYLYTPAAVNQSKSVNEGGSISFDPLASSNIVWGSKSPDYNKLSIDLGSATGDGVGGHNGWVWNAATHQLSFDTGNNYDYLAMGDTAFAKIIYHLDYPGVGQDGADLNTQGMITLEIDGLNDNPEVGASISDITKPANIVNGATTTPTTGVLVIPTQAFQVVDQGDTLNYSITNAGGMDVGTNKDIWVAKNGVTGLYEIHYDLAGVSTGDYTIEVTAKDNHYPATPNPPNEPGKASTSFVFHVVADDHVPTTNGGIPDQTVDEKSGLGPNEQGVDVSGYFSDQDTGNGDTLTYSITNETGPGADWVSISPEGTLVGTPGNDNDTLWGTGPDGGKTRVTVRATDQFGQYVEQDVLVTVNNVNDAPIVDHAIGQVVAEEGTGATTFNFDVITGDMNSGDHPSGGPGPYFDDIDPTNDTISYTAYVLDDHGNRLGEVLSNKVDGYASGVGSWLRFNGTKFTGTPTDTLGTVFAVELVATDNHGADTSTTFTIGEFAHAGVVVNNGGPGAVSGGLRGFSTAMSDDGAWAAYGEPGMDRVLIYDANSWNANPIVITGTSGSHFGTSVSLSGDGSHLVVGAPDAAGGGSVIYYTLNGAGTDYNKGNTLTAVNAGRFGYSVSVSDDGNNIVVGAPGASTDGEAYQAGWDDTSVSVTFTPNHSGNMGGYTDAAIDGHDGADNSGDRFGYSVAMSDGMIAIGAPRDNIFTKVDAGSVYVYDPGSNTLVTRVLRRDAYASDGYFEQDSTYFGRSVSVDSYSGNYVLAVGAPYDDGMPDPTDVSHHFTDAGAVYLFQGSSSDVTYGMSNGKDGTVYAYDGQPLHNFGLSVSVDIDSSDNIRFVAGGDFNGGEPGSVYVYHYYQKHNGNHVGWLGQRFDAKAPANTDFADNRLGYSVGIGDSHVSAGAPYAERGNVPSAGLPYHVDLEPSTTVEDPFSAPVVKGQAYNPGSGTGQIIQPPADMSMATPHLLSDATPYGNTAGRTSDYLQSDWAGPGLFTSRAHEGTEEINPLLYQRLIDEPVSKLLALNKDSADQQGQPHGNDTANRASGDDTQPTHADHQTSSQGQGKGEPSGDASDGKDTKATKDTTQPAPNAARKAEAPKPDSGTGAEAKQGDTASRDGFNQQIQQHGNKRDHEAASLLDSLTSLVA